jgi:hypothetical protein
LEIPENESPLSIEANVFLSMPSPQGPVKVHFKILGQGPEVLDDFERLVAEKLAAGYLPGGKPRLARERSDPPSSSTRTETRTGSTSPGSSPALSSWPARTRPAGSTATSRARRFLST